MAFSLTYNSLVQTITNYLERSDPNLVSTIPTFILLAQNRINRDLKTLLTEKYVTDTMIAGNPVIFKQNNWRQTLSFKYRSLPNNNTTYPLQLRTYEYCRAYWPDVTITGVPLYYADYEQNAFLIVPTPDQNYRYELAYLTSQTLIDSTIQTNQITMYCPELLIYGSLLETASFLKDDDRLPLWTTYYQDALNALKKEDSDRKTTRASDVTKD